MLARRKLFSFTLPCIVIAISSVTFADSVSVVGSGYLGSDLDGLSVNAGSFSATSAAPGGPSLLFGFHSIDTLITESWGSAAFSGPGFTTVNIGNQFTDILVGGPSFTSTFSVSAADLAAGFFIAPVTVTGELQAFQDLLLGTGTGEYQTGPLMATLQFTGTGLGTFQIVDAGQGGFDTVFGAVSFTGNGTLTTVVPEPNSLFLMGTGILSLFGIARRKLMP